MKQFKIKKEHKQEVKQYCLDNLGKENIRWWFAEDMMGLRSFHDRADTLHIDVTEAEEIYLTHFILKYGE